MWVSVSKGVVLQSSWMSMLVGILKSFMNSLIAKSSTIRNWSKSCGIWKGTLLGSFHFCRTFRSVQHYVRSYVGSRERKRERNIREGFWMSFCAKIWGPKQKKKPLIQEDENVNKKSRVKTKLAFRDDKKDRFSSPKCWCHRISCLVQMEEERAKTSQKGNSVVETRKGNIT